MLKDLGIECKIIVCTDSSAAKGIANRRGLGKVRHIELCELWLQDQVARGKIRVDKIAGVDNFSDSLAKHATADRINQTMRCSNQVIASGRRSIMPFVAS